jgi:hypothetical protein
MSSGEPTLPHYRRPGVALGVLAALGLCGCDPVLNIAGANFPAWLFCVLAGALLAALWRLLFIALGIDSHLWPRALVYISLAVLMACLVYAACFNRM